MPSYRIARLGLGYVPEDRRIFTDLTVDENLEVGTKPAAAAGGRAPWTPERLFSIFPNLAEMRGRRASQMSGGEQQMLTIARTLMGNPEAVLLDEPSEGLAPVIVEQMAAAVAPHEGRGHRRAAVRAEPLFRRAPSPTAPTSSRRAPSATRAAWPTSPPMRRCARRTCRCEDQVRRPALPQCLCVPVAAGAPGWRSKPCGPMAPRGSTVASTSISPAFSNTSVSLRRSPSFSGALRSVSMR